VSRRLAILTLLAVVLTPSAHAATSGPVFGIRAGGNPKLGYFVYNTGPGTVRSGSIIVSNTGNRAGTVKLYTADATTGRTTGTVYLTDKPPTATGAWVKLSSSSLTLAPGRHATVPFTVRVPSNAKVGQWVGGIVAETRQAAQGPKAKHKANVRIKIRNLTIVAVQVNVPGTPIVAFTIGTVTTGGQRGFQQVIVHFANKGNLLRKPAGTVTISDSAGKVVEVLPFKMDTFLPHTAIDYPLLLTKALPPGDYHALVKLAVPGAVGAAVKTVIAKPSFSVSNQDVTQVFTSSKPSQVPTTGLGDTQVSSSLTWALIAASATGLLLLALLIFQLVRRRRHKEPVEPIRRSASAGPVSTPTPAAAAVPAPFPAPRAPAAPPQPAPPPRPVSAEPVPTAPPAAAQPAYPTCDPSHFWEVAYDRGQLGGDGVWRFPHRCRTCGLELFASDIADASAQAATARASSS
jgi:hypothetical protein